MRVLVTGHQGYLGTVMVPVLSSAGHDVTGLDNGLFAECVLGSPPNDPIAFHCDLRDLGVDELRGFDAVIHLAALSNDPLGALAPEVTYDINHRAAVRLARHAKAAGVRRFLYASTCSVYGASGADLVSESASLCPLTPYAESKVRVEADVAAMADESFSPVFLRNATAFGFSPRLRADIVLNNLVGHAVLTGCIRVLSDGTPWRPLVHARDIATAFRLVLEAPLENVHNRAFNVGSETNNVTVAQIAGIVADAVPGATLQILGETGGDSRSYRVDFSALRDAVGFEAEWSVAAGAAELREKYLTEGLVTDDFTRRFTRLAHLESLIASGAVDESIRRVTADA